jgi:hypothetical protein
VGAADQRQWQVPVKGLRLCLLSLIAILSNASVAAALTEIDPNSSLARQAIAVALPEFQHSASDFQDYEAIVVRDGPSLWVLFKDATAPQGQRGGGFEVELDADATRILSSHYGR